LLDFATDILRWGWVVVEATLLILLFRRKLARRYPLFVAFLVVEWIQMAALLAVDPISQFYAKCWAASEILLLFALALAAVEVTRKILEYYPVIKELASSSFGMIFTAGAVGSVVLLQPFFDASNYQPAQTYFVLKVLRWESLTLFAFLGAQAVWFRLFPIKMRRNVVLHRWLLALYGGAVPGVSVFVYDLYERDRTVHTWINLSMMAIQISLMSAWCIWFTERGEQTIVETKYSTDQLTQAAHAATPGMPNWQAPLTAAHGLYEPAIPPVNPQLLASDQSRPHSHQ
jgi:hypothetical protein